MAEVRLPNDVSTEIWGTQALVVTAGSETTSDSFYVDKGVYGPKYISISFVPTTPGTAVQIDLQISQGGVIWHTIRKMVNPTGERLEFFAPQGFFRVRAVSFTGAGTAFDVDCVARSVIDRIEINSIGPVADTITEGAAMLIGSATQPISQDTADTAFVSINVVSDAVGNQATYGLRTTLDCGGVLSYYQTAIHGQMNCTAVGNLRNPVALQGDLNFADGCWVQGLGYGIGTYISLPGNATTTGTFTGMNVEIAADAGFTKGASPIMSLLRAGLSGDATAITNIEDTLFLMEIFGLNEGTGNCFSAGADVAAAATLRIRVGTTAYYILLGAGEST